MWSSRDSTSHFRNEPGFSCALQGEIWDDVAFFKGGRPLFHRQHPARVATFFAQVGAQHSRCNKHASASGWFRRQGLTFLGDTKHGQTSETAFGEVRASQHEFTIFCGSKTDLCPWEHIPEYNCFLPPSCLEQLQISSNLPLQACHDFVKITTCKSGRISIYSTHQSSQFTVNPEFPCLALFLCLFVGSLTCPNSWVMPTTSSGLNNFPELQGWRLTIWFLLQVLEKYTQIRWIQYLYLGILRRHQVDVGRYNCIISVFLKHWTKQWFGRRWDWNKCNL